MRTANQIQSKINELTQQKKMLQARLEPLPEESAERRNLNQQAARLEDMIMMLEWVLNEPDGKYHM
ncbi:hypothetical protein [Paenibacillus sp. DMB20]|uniref:hypothetical protein n=1 Tax=Paenibacillus sp. DMB20 TaxID=1642570 RepID=UPI000627C433|nr:hypothetical protein [Paenibacillus sp. DMB20]KKO54457.1 hypothetical protein XI25_06495 [Paenibacillus sp. DMB20]